MAQPQPTAKIHPGNLLTLAIDPKKMEAAQEAFNRVVDAAFIPHKRGIENVAVLVGLATTQDNKPFFAAEVITPVANSAEMRPLLATLHLVVTAIYDLVKDHPPDDDAAFDSAMARTTALFQQRGVEPNLVTIYVETAMSVIHSETFGDMKITTLYGDGRLIVLKGSVLRRLLLDHRKNLPHAS